MRELAIPPHVRADYVERGWWRDRRLIEHIERAARIRGDVAAVVDESASVAVVGYPDRRLGERARNRRAGRGSASNSRLARRASLRGLGCATYKLPERLELAAELPMTSSGKVEKVKLKRWLASDAADARVAALA